MYRYVLLLEPVRYFSFSLFLFDQLVKSNSQYDSILRENSNTLVVIKFFAPWCRSCKALDVKYRRMAVKYENVTFVEVREKNWLTVVGSNTTRSVRDYSPAAGKYGTGACMMQQYINGTMYRNVFI